MPLLPCLLAVKKNKRPALALPLTQHWTAQGLSVTIAWVTLALPIACTLVLASVFNFRQAALNDGQIYLFACSRSNHQLALGLAEYLVSTMTCNRSIDWILHVPRSRTFRSTSDHLMGLSESLDS